jgi:hypothetical protein
MPHDDEIRALWKEAPSPSIRPSVAAFRRKQRWLTLRVRVRNALEYGAALLVIAGCVAGIADAPTGGVKLACLVMIAAAVVVVKKLHRDGSPLPAPPADATSEATIAHHRASLVRQRDLLREVPRWYLAPLGGAILFFYVVVSIEAAQTAPLLTILQHLWKPLAGTAALYLMIAHANRVAARRLDDQVRTLDEEIR